jgi:fimbrial chaperone protein
MRNNAIPTLSRNSTTLGRLTAAAFVLLASGTAWTQSLTVLPVNIEMAPKQMATTLTIINQGEAETSVQFRAFAWKQPDGNEELTPSSEMQVSPPIATIAPGAAQIVRLVLRRPPKEREATYRILVDQIPPAAAPGTVRIALRLSIPVFAAPPTKVASNVQFSVERKAGQSYLVAMNKGTRHETLREVALQTDAGGKLTTAANNSPYILAGAAGRWPISAPGGLPAPGETLHLTARTTAGAVDERVAVVAAP